ncbi:LIVCS family branched-chain amino acid:cation transporter [Clostridium pascui]|uniref:branched-chain amino acid transport system II carrier protein n=1 Tax=Clostridium pascui TaxID=46609 RepID=UPI001A9C84B3|nr:branched-chain amino acid transport system II carrier protein [Clostridium pascui]MBM7870806.1 LIVCS family branched-chain amino acid:cation transporter [Clostridium pascui]
MSIKKDNKNIIITGFALFSMFFGAGNLIFPPTLGFISGDKWIFTMIGFLLTCISLPLLGIIAVALCGGSTEKFTNKVGNKFGKFLCSIIMLSIGPLFCIPRTGASTFELGVQPMFANANPIVVSIIFFAITLFLTLNESNVVDKVGAILTPVLLIALLIIIVKGIFFPMGEAVSNDIVMPFSRGFTEGYQTMDALGSIIMAQMVVGDLIVKGYKNRKEQVSITIKSGIVSAVCLAIVYGGLLYIGATASGMFDKDISRTALLIGVTSNILGPSSKIIFGAAISIACLTTAIGLTATAGNYFSNLTNGKLSYKLVVTLICIFSAFISNYGVETIINFAVPVLVTAYPVVIVLILMNLFNNYIEDAYIYKGAVYATLVVSLVNSLSSLKINIPYITYYVNELPMSAQGFGWIIPCALGAILGSLYGRSKKAPSFLKEINQES